MWSPVVLLLAYSAYLVGGQKAGEKCRKGSLVNGRLLCQRRIIFEDDFNKFENVKWKQSVYFPENPDYEFVMYDRAANNTYIRDGILFIKPSLLTGERSDDFLYKGRIDLNSYPPKPMRCTKKPQSSQCSADAKKGFRMLPPILSARLTSRMRFRYGSVEVRAKVPLGDWIYPQLELTAENSKYGKSAGTIVIAMTRGNLELKMPSGDQRLNFGVKWLEAGAFAGSYDPLSTQTMVADFRTQGWHTEFHKFRVDWNEDELQWFVDDQPIGKGKVSQVAKGFLPWANSKFSPFDEEMEVALGVGVGGVQRFPDPLLSGGRRKPWKNSSPKCVLNFWKDRGSWLPSWKGEDSALQVDYVKVWSRTGQ